MSHLSIIINFARAFINKNAKFSGEQEKESIINKDVIEKSVSQHHHLSSLSKPCDAK